jgi:hypothetical protein
MEKIFEPTTANLFYKILSPLANMCRPEQIGNLFYALWATGNHLRWY